MLWFRKLPYSALVVGLLGGISGGILGMSEFRSVLTDTLPNGLPFHFYKLPNGLRVYIVENHSAPVFTFQLWYKVGSKHEKLDPKIGATGLAHLFEHMMFRGTKNVADGEFDKILTKNGLVDGNATTWLDRTNYYESLPADKLDLVLELEADRMANLQISQEVFDTEREAVLGEYNMGLDDPETVAYDKLYETAFLKHPYRYTTIGTEQEIKSFTREMAMYFYDTYYSPGNASILIVGDVDPKNTVNLIVKHFGQMAEKNVPQFVASPEPPQTIERRVEFKHEQLQSPKLVLGYHTPAVRHADIPALLVAESILTNGESSVLEDVWVNGGLAVGMMGMLNVFEDPGLLLIAADLQPGKTVDELLGSLDTAISKLTQSLKPAQIARGKNQLLLEIYHQWEENASLANFMGEFIASADHPLYAFELTQKVKDVKLEEVREVISRYLVATNRTVVLGLPDEDASDADSPARRPAR